MVLEGNLLLHARQGEPERPMLPRSAMARTPARQDPEEQAAGRAHQIHSRKQREAPSGGESAHLRSHIDRNTRRSNCRRQQHRGELHLGQRRRRGRRRPHRRPSRRIHRPQSRLRGHGEHQHGQRHGPGRTTELATSKGSGPKWRRSAIVPNPDNDRRADNGKSAGAGPGSA
eukprot:3566481-Pleurochrysis_carterae.AAC.1